MEIYATLQVGMNRINGGKLEISRGLFENLSTCHGKFTDKFSEFCGPFSDVLSVQHNKIFHVTFLDFLQAILTRTCNKKNMKMNINPHDTLPHGDERMTTDNIMHEHLIAIIRNEIQCLG